MRWKRNLNAVERASVSPETIDDYYDLIEAIRFHLQRLPTKYREAIVLCDIEELSRQEAAARMGIPIATLTTRLSRGRKILRRRLSLTGIAVATVLPLTRVSTADSGVPASLTASTTDYARQLMLGRSAVQIGISPAILQLTKIAARSMVSSAFRTIGIVAMTACLLFSLTHAAVDERVFSLLRASIITDDFRDGQADGWTFIDNTRGAWAPGTYDTSSGELVLASSGFLASEPEGISDSLFAMLNSSDDRLFSNVVFVCESERILIQQGLCCSLGRLTAAAMLFRVALERMTLPSAVSTQRPRFS